MASIKQREASAFTLLELLVVIAIVAVLATISSAVWQRSQRSANAAKCINNLRGLGTALTKYLGDNDGTFPTLVLAREKKTDPQQAIDTVLKPYISDPRILACPADERKLWETSGTSYLWNWKLNGQRISAVRVSFVGKNTIDEPSNVMVMGDKEGFHPVENRKVNVLYADGRVTQELTFVDETPAPK